MLRKYEISNNKNNSLIISVAMCTYNGGKYLQEQLYSIVKQTQLPDEIVICDDGSIDSTLQILNEFKKNAAFQVRIYHNEKRLGPTKNFEKAINLCKGDIIVLSDQDDVWLPHKIEKIKYIFKNSPDIGYVFSDAIVVDEKLNPFRYTLWGYVSFTASQRKIFKQGYQIEVLIKHNVVTGATMAFSSKLKDWILPIPEEWVHDEWTALLASSAEEKGIFIEEPLMKYRLHPKQLISINVDDDKRLKLIEQFKRAYNTKSECYKIRADRIGYALNRLVLANKLTKRTNNFLEDGIKHSQTREWIHNHSRWKRLRRVFRELISGRYHRFANGWKSVIKDLCL